MSLIKEKLELKIEEAEFNAQQALIGFPRWVKWFLIAGLIMLIPIYFCFKFIGKTYWQNKLQTYELKASPSFISANDLQVSEVTIIDYYDGNFGALASISNPNPDLSASEINYTWLYVNASNQTVQALNNDALGGKTFILPGQKKYIMAPKINASEPIAKAQLIINGDIQWQKPANIDKVLLTIGPAIPGQQNSPQNFTVDSTVLNNSTYQIKHIRLQFLIFDEFGRLTALSQRTENDLRPFERRSFKQLWPGLRIYEPKVEIYPEINLLDPSNLILSESNSSSSDLSRPENNRSW